MENLTNTNLSTEKAIQAFLANTSIEELIPFILNEPIDFGMVIAWGTYCDLYEYGTPEERATMLKSALEQMPSDLLENLFYGHFIKKEY